MTNGFDLVKKYAREVEKMTDSEKETSYKFRRILDIFSENSDVVSRMFNIEQEQLETIYELTKDCYSEFLKMIDDKPDAVNTDDPKTPILQIDCYNNRVEVFEEGNQVHNVTSIKFDASMGSIPEYTVTKKINSNGSVASWSSGVSQKWHHEV